MSLPGWYRAVLLSLAAVAGCSDASGPVDSAPDPQTKANTLVAGPVVALLASKPLGTTTDLVLQPAGAATPAAAVATLSHVRGGEVRGAVLPGTGTVVVVADMESRHEPSWGAWLMRLEANAAPHKLVDRVYHATRPLVLADGRVFVERGRAGAEPTPEEAKQGKLRVDELTIDEVDPQTGATRTVYAWSGYIAFLAGALDDELLVYRVTYHHADLVAVDAKSGAERVIAAEIPAFARDFSVDRQARALVYTNRDAASGQWAARRLDLASGALTTLATSPRMALSPHAWPGRGVVINPSGASGLVKLAGSGAAIAAPYGSGVDSVRLVTPDGKWAAVVHEVPDHLPAPFVLSPETGQTIPVAFPPGKRVDVAGFVR